MLFGAQLVNQLSLYLGRYPRHHPHYRERKLEQPLVVRPFPSSRTRVSGRET